ncbi:RNA-directed RNA polymerase [Dirofilaria immitis]
MSSPSFDVIRSVKDGFKDGFNDQRWVVKSFFQWVFAINSSLANLEFVVAQAKRGSSRSLEQSKLPYAACILPARLLRIILLGLRITIGSIVS